MLTHLSPRLFPLYSDNRKPVNAWLHLSGRLSIDEAFRIMGVTFETDAATLAGFVLEQLGHISHENETWLWKGSQWSLECGMFCLS